MSLSKYSKDIFMQDAIYKLMLVPSYCLAFIDTPEFQRLRRVKQLGMTEYAFHTGTHSRFEHCIGVMHLGGVFFDNLIRNSAPEYKKFADYKKLIQIAGLLHDLGHGPKSHLFEEALKIKGIKFCHENQSIRLVKKINSRLNILTDEELSIVEAMILGKKLDGYPPFLFEIIANKDSGLDVDKFDYLKRDAMHTGKSQMTDDYIIKHCKIDRNMHVSYYVKAEEEIKTVFLTRRNMYAHMYFHKTVAKVDKMMICALMQMTFDVDDLDEYIKYDDSYLDYHIRHILKHDLVRCLDNIQSDGNSIRKFDHKCDKCPDVRLNRVAKLSGDTDEDPLLFIRFYD